MRKTFLTTSCLLLAGWLICSPAHAQKTSEAKTKEIADKGTKIESVLSINFVDALGLNFDSLATLGVRIEGARKAADPVALANAATYLAAIEEVSGKKAGLTAEALKKEAIETAKERGYANELKTVAVMFKGTAAAKELVALAQKAEEREDKELADIKAGVKTRGIQGFVTAVNNTQYKIFVSEDSVQLGWINPYRTYTFNVRIGHGPGHNSVLRGRSQNGQVVWGPRRIDFTVNNYTWVLD